MQKPHIRKPWERERVYRDLGENVSMTDRSQGNDTNINRIVERFARTGSLPENAREPVYADVTHLQVDMTEAIERGRAAGREYEAAIEKSKAAKRDQAKKEKEELEEFRRQAAEQLAKPMPDGQTPE